MKNVYCGKIIYSDFSFLLLDSYIFFLFFFKEPKEKEIIEGTEIRGNLRF